MRIAVLTAMTLIALSSTPLVRLAFGPAQESSVPALRAPLTPVAHAASKARVSLPGVSAQISH